MKTAIVTGGTSGLGLAAAQTLAEKGLRVYALSRHGAPVPGVTSLACDITDADAVERTVAAIEAEAGRIDLVVNNAGFGISGAVECTTPEEARRLFDVDFFGVVNVNHAVLPRMRRAGGGRISRSVSRMEHDEQTGMPPEKAAAFLCRVALRRRTKPLYAIGPQYSAAVLLSRLLPCRLVSWIVSRLYAA